MKAHLKNLVAILIGAAIMGFGINFFNLANGLAEGGVTGITLLLKYLFDWDPGIMNLLINIPLFVLGWKVLGRKSFCYTVYGTVCLSVFLFLFREARFPMNDLLLASLYAGVTLGIGLGIIFRYGGTSGGTDILAQILNRYLGWPIGKSMLLFDMGLISLSLYYLDQQRAMYTIVAVFIGTKVIDFVQEGAYRAKAATIISSEAKTISDKILIELERGTTVLKGRGGYSGEDKEILYCVVSRSEIVKLKRLVHEIDPYAFVIVNEVFEVLGEGFGQYETIKTDSKAVS